MRKRRAVYFIGGGLLFVIVLLGSLLLLTANSGRNADLAAMRKLGAITSLEEWNAHLPKNGEDAAPTYKKLTAMFNDLPGARKEPLLTLKFYVTKSTRAEKQAGLKQTIDQYEALLPIIDLSRKASNMERFVIPYDPEGDQYGDEDSVIDAAMVLEFAAYAESEKGDMDAAFADFEHVGHILEQLRQNLEYSAWRNYSAIQSDLLLNLRRLMQEQPNNPDVMNRVIKVVDGLPPLRDIENDFLSLPLDSVYFAQRAEEDPNKYLDGTIFVNKSTQRTISLWGRVQAHFVLNKAFHVQRETLELMPKDHGDWRGIQNAFFEGDKLSSALSELRVGPHANTANEAAVGDWVSQRAGRRMTIAAAKILLDRIDKGHLPSTLPDFGESSIDPFTDRPFHYAVNGNSFEINSEPDAFNSLQRLTFAFTNLPRLPILEDRDSQRYAP